MNRKTLLLTCLVAVATPLNASAGTIDFVDNGQFVDVFLTPSDGSEFTNFDLIVTPAIGGLLDPEVETIGSFDKTLSRVDTWVNTPFSSLNAGDPSLIFTEYHPGAPPFQTTENAPTAGADGSAGNPARLNWSVFDTAVGDTAQFAPYHVARVLYSQGGGGQIEILAFDTATASTGGERFGSFYGRIIPEPATIMLAGLGLVSLLTLRRKI